MKSVFNKLRSNRAGAVALEFTLVVVPFFILFVATVDLGRFYLTQHSLRTLTSELARQALIYCTNQPNNAVCSLPSSGTISVATAKNAVPFLISGSFASTPTGSRSVMDATAGTMTITASASYNFAFMAVWSLFVPSWNNTVTLTQSTSISY